ncbi:MAG: penicillin-binding transpeptidase domain-containing protein [Oscillospiraceae bacterium]|nr:penicillin-binding transpeptidase domain-containing protein [Oscillospiraceae bacterium]
MKISSLRWRRWFLCLLCLAVTGFFIATLMDIQIINAEEHRRSMEGRFISTQTLRAARGEIVDRNHSPINVNRMGYDIILDRAWLPLASQNEVLYNLIELSERLGFEWIDNLPISTRQPYYFLPETAAAQERLRAYLRLQPYATAEDVMFQLVNRFNLEDFDARTQRQIAAVRWEMLQRGFSLNVVYTFASDVPRAEAIRIREHSHMLPGVNVIESTIRHHVNGLVAPHIIGTVGPIFAEEFEEMRERGYAMDDMIGRGGAEHAFEPILRGINGRREIHMERGRVVQVVESQPPVPGNTVVLSIDVEMQLALQNSLRDQIYRLQETALPGQGREADSGAAVVLDVRTGEVLAIATYPSYNMSTFREDYAQLAQDPLTPLVNRALHGTYAIGSTFKPITALAGLETGAVNQHTLIGCHRNFQVGTHVFTCLSYHGNINLHTAMARSCNIYFYEIGRRIGINAIDSVAYSMGLGVLSGIEISEREGHRSNPDTKMAVMGEQWFEGDLIQSTIGQLLHSYTPLQVANYTATLANRGTRMNVTIVHEIRDYSLQNIVEPFRPQVAHQSDIDRAHFESVVSSMVAASRPGGTAASIFGWYPIDVASKTGTPETGTLPNSAFIAFAPAVEPELAIAIIIENGWHGFTSAPVARDIFDLHFGFERAPPAPSPAGPDQSGGEEPIDPEESEAEDEIGE